MPEVTIRARVAHVLRVFFRRFLNRSEESAGAVGGEEEEEEIHSFGRNERRNGV